VDRKSPKRPPTTEVEIFGAVYNVHGRDDGAYLEKVAALVDRKVFPPRKLLSQGARHQPLQQLPCRRRVAAIRRRIDSGDRYLPGLPW
jgi:cell division protein ZapA (FtsZ GTPase activity inhibitor)